MSIFISPLHATRLADQPKSGQGAASVNEGSHAFVAASRAAVWGLGAKCRAIGNFVIGVTRLRHRTIDRSAGGTKVSCSDGKVSASDAGLSTRATHRGFAIVRRRRHYDQPLKDATGRVRASPQLMKSSGLHAVARIAHQLTPD
jgi:hypothetical protein